MRTWIFIGILISIMSGGVYYYYTSTQSRIEALIENNTALNENNKQLATANNRNLQTIDDLQDSYQEIQKEFTQVQSEFRVIQMQNSELLERLGRHDLGALALSKPELIQRTINNASGKVNRCFEVLSGSPIKNNETNTECPWLFSTNE